MALLSFHNDPTIKAKYVARFAAHRAADEVIQGTGFENGRGGFVGCTLDSYDHSRFPIELGWPVWLAQLADTIFEGIPSSECAQFGTDILEAVPVGVDLEPIRFRFLLTIQQRNLTRVGSRYTAVRAAIEQAIEYLQNPSSEEKRKATWSAGSAAARATVEAAMSAAMPATVWSPAGSASTAAMSAAWSAGSVASAAGRSAEAAALSAGSERKKEFQTQRDDLLALLRESGKV